MAIDYEKRSWYYSDNGFDSIKSMDSFHKPIIKLVISTLKGKKANIIDFGCGNGALLKKIYDLNHNVVPFGIEIDKNRLKHVKILFPDFTDNFFTGNIFEIDKPWTNKVKYDLAILMPGRFTEYSNEYRKNKFKEKIKKHTDKLLVYYYGGGTKRWKNIKELSNEVSIRLVSKSINKNVSLAKFIK